MISGVLWANNGCSSLEALQVRIKTGDPKIGLSKIVWGQKILGSYFRGVK